MPFIVIVVHCSHMIPKVIMTSFDCCLFSKIIIILYLICPVKRGECFPTNNTIFVLLHVHVAYSPSSLFFFVSLPSSPSLSLSSFLSVEDVLKKGHVPPPPQYYVKRTDLIRSIRQELRKLKNTDSWVLLSGLPGYGE